jgi:Lrp/AsnC family transcriptional regulator, leucine-responsive regulatory protein
LIAAAGAHSLALMDGPADTRQTPAFGLDELDELDVQLLNILQSDNQLTAEALARRIALSTSSAQRRLHRLRDCGLIAREAAVVTDAFLERRASGIVLVQLRRQTVETVQALKRRLEHCPEVQLIFEISGAFDLFLLVVERDLAAFHAFTSDLLAASPEVQRFEISFVKTRLKASLAVPLDGRDVR